MFPSGWRLPLPGGKWTGFEPKNVMLHHQPPLGFQSQTSSRVWLVDVESRMAADESPPRTSLRPLVVKVQSTHRVSHMPHPRHTYSHAHTLHPRITAQGSNEYSLSANWAFVVLAETKYRLARVNLCKRLRCTDDWGHWLKGTRLAALLQLDAGCVGV